MPNIIIRNTGIQSFVGNGVFQVGVEAMEDDGGNIVYTSALISGGDLPATQNEKMRDAAVAAFGNLPAESGGPIVVGPSDRKTLHGAALGL